MIAISGLTRMYKIILLVALVACASAVFVQRPATFESRLGHQIYSAHECNFQENCHLHDFRRIGRAELADEHTITIWSRQNNIEASCGSLLMEVSDPGNPFFLSPPTLLSPPHRHVST